MVNPKNHHLNGRDLVVEYASAEAVRRGAPKPQRPKVQKDSTTSDGKYEKYLGIPKDLSHKPRQFAREDKKVVMDVDASASDVAPELSPASKIYEKDFQKERDNRNKGKPRGRPKPGAALALAKRESAAIVPSQGQKITF